MSELGSKEDYVEKLIYDFGEGHSVVIEFWAKELAKLAHYEVVIEAVRKYVKLLTTRQGGLSPLEFDEAQELWNTLQKTLTAPENADE